MQCLMLIFFPMANVIGPNFFGLCMFILECLDPRLLILFLLLPCCCLSLTPQRGLREGGWAGRQGGPGWPP